MKKRICLFICIILVLTQTAVAFSANTGDREEVYQTSLTTAESKKIDTKYVNYDFGKRVVKKPSKKRHDSPYRLRGIMSYPKSQKGKLKPIIILHGQHDNDNLRRYDVGFKYLVDYLGQNGYLGISIDINSAYHWANGDNEDRYRTPFIFEEQMKILKKLNKGMKNKYGIKLKNKIDFNNVMLLGHSTGGTLIFDLAKEQQKYGMKVKSMFALAPSDNFVGMKFNVKTDSINFLVPEFDGDVVAHDGFGIYEKIRKSTNQKKNSAVLLRYANHNYFNTIVKINDAEGIPVDKTKQIKAQTQRDFLNKYTVSLAKATLDGNEENTIFDNNLKNIETIDNLKVFTSISKNGGKVLVSDSDKPSFMTPKVTRESLIDATTEKHDTADGLVIPVLGGNKTKVERYTYETEGQGIKFDLKDQDLTMFNEITLRLTIDPSMKQNKKRDSQGLTVVLEDINGKKAKVTIPPKSNLIDYPDGDMYKIENSKDEIIEIFDGRTFLKQVRIPVSMFKDISMASLKTIGIDFDQTSSGSIALREIVAF